MCPFVWLFVRVCVYLFVRLSDCTMTENNRSCILTCIAIGAFVCLFVCSFVCLSVFASFFLTLNVGLFVCAVIDKHINCILTCIGSGILRCFLVCLYDAQQVIYHCQMDRACGMRTSYNWRCEGRWWALRSFLHPCSSTVLQAPKATKNNKLKHSDFKKNDGERRLEAPRVLNRKGASLGNQGVRERSSFAGRQPMW